MVTKIIGISSYEKEGVKNFTLNFLQEYSDYDKEHGAQGVKVGSVWTQLPVCNSLWVNDLVELRYEPGFQGKAILTDIVRYNSNDKHYLNNFVVPDTAIAVPGIPDKSASSAETATTAKGSK